MDRVVLRYGKSSFVIITILLVIMSAIVVVFLSSFIIGRSIIYPVGVLCLICVLIYGILPMLTYHYIENGVLVLNQGLFFRGRVPISDIVSVEVVENGPFRTGVFFNIRGAVLYVTTRRKDLLVIKLREKRRYGLALGKSVDTLIFDCLETRKAMDVLTKDLTPASPDRPS
jgi:hypothetical protein